MPLTNHFGADKTTIAAIRRGLVALSWPMRSSSLPRGVQYQRQWLTISEETASVDDSSTGDPKLATLASATIHHHSNRMHH